MQSAIGMILGFLAIPVVWAGIVYQTRERWRWVGFSHLAGALMAFPTMFTVFVVVTEPNVAGLVFLTIYSVILWLIVRPWGKKTASPEAPAPAMPSPSPMPPAVDTGAVEATRQRSLAAMKRATAARKQDKADRQEGDPVRLSWQEHAAEPRPSSYLAEIEFDYVDARSNESHRELGVEAVDDEYFEGFCRTAMATRTFVIGRVRGKITNMETGELLPPKKWAAQMRRDPRNGIVAMGGEWKHDDEDYDDEPLVVAAEILFTGFPKAQRAELEELAELRGMKVVKSVTRNLVYLCAGPTAGPAKIEQAGEVGAGILTVAGFLELADD